MGRDMDNPKICCRNVSLRAGVNDVRDVYAGYL
jgi:hypothetical protein